MQIGFKNKKLDTQCYFKSVIFWPFWFCLFYLIGLDCGLQNFYTEFWNSLIMQIYANLLTKSTEKCYLVCQICSCQRPILILFVLSDRAWCGLHRNFYTEFIEIIYLAFVNLCQIARLEVKYNDKNATSLSWVTCRQRLLILCWNIIW